MAKKQQISSLPKKPRNEVLVPMMCHCTFKPHPHFHKTSNIELEPWNWEKTQAIWAKENESKKPKIKAT